MWSLAPKPSSSNLAALGGAASRGSRLSQSEEEMWSIADTSGGASSRGSGGSGMALPSVSPELAPPELGSATLGRLSENFGALSSTGGTYITPRSRLCVDS